MRRRRRMKTHPFSMRALFPVLRKRHVIVIMTLNATKTLHSYVSLFSLVKCY